MIATLFTAPIAPQPKPRERSKRHRSSRTSEGDEALSRKKERTDLEVARRTSIIDEETRQMRSREFAGGASSSSLEVVERITTEGAENVVGTTEDAETTEVVGYEKLNPLAC